jgi:ABC-type nitrate/sulfonate/bicarbonate transport system ATPase subunit
MKEAVELAVEIRAMDYPERKLQGHLIEDLAFSVLRGKIVSFLGPTAAGKTTMFRIIAGFEHRYQGSVSLGGDPVVRPSRRVQVVFQDYRLLPWKNVYDNVAFALNGTLPTTEVEPVEQWLRKLGMWNRRDSYPKTLSGGETGRTALARAFVSAPRVLLLDEPFLNLDLATRYVLQDELVKVLAEQRTTALLVSHNIEDAVFLSDEVCILSQGPMTIKHRIPVSLPRPRRRDHPDLGAVAAEVVRHVTN